MVKVIRYVAVKFPEGIQGHSKLGHIYTLWGSCGEGRLDLWGRWCQKQVSQAGISDCIAQYILWDAVTYPCLRYLLLAPKSSFAPGKYLAMLWLRFVWYRVFALLGIVLLTRDLLCFAVLLYRSTSPTSLRVIHWHLAIIQLVRFAQNHRRNPGA